MAQSKGLKRPLISISSSSEDDDDEHSQEESESEFSSEEEEDDDDDEEHDPRYYDEHVLDISSSNSSEEEDDDDNNDDDDESESDAQDYEEDESSDDEDLDNDEDDDDDDDLIRNRVICLLRDGSDLQELNLTECKAYLRKHGLRLSGTKAECIQRIKEHWRLKDGSGEALYPRSSFSINCTGDVCKGDAVLFTQKVYKKFDKVTRRGSIMGKRIIAGRIVKESYGAAKQQHTFTVEVLWSKGIKKLPSLSTLLVKGRNLYKLKTFRQRWKSEAERSKVLAEKHRRGAAARHIRAMKKTKKTSHPNAGTKRQKLSHFTPSRMKQPTRTDKQKCAEKRGVVPSRNVRSNNHSRKLLQAEQVNLTHWNRARQPTFQPNSYPSQYFHHSQREYHQNKAPLAFPCDVASSAATMRLPYSRPNPNSYRMPASELQGFNRGSYLDHAYTHPTYESVPSKFSQYPGLTNTYRPPPPFHWRTELYENRRYGY